MTHRVVCSINNLTFPITGKVGVIGENTNTLYGWTRLQSACFRNDHDTANDLIASGEDANETTRRCPVPSVLIAASMGHASALKVLLNCDRVPLNNVIHSKLEESFVPAAIRGTRVQRLTVDAA